MDSLNRDYSASLARILSSPNIFDALLLKNSISTSANAERKSSGRLRTIMRRDDS
jgi:hypothetical protein